MTNNIVACFEGMDGSGKSYFIHKFLEHLGDRISLNEMEFKVQKISSLESTQIGRDLKIFLLKSVEGNDHNSLSQLRSTLGVHHELLKEVILKSSNTLFLQDRSLISTYVYQILNKPLRLHSELKCQMTAFLKEYNSMLGDTRVLFVCFKIKAPLALENIKKRGEIDSIEKDLQTLKNIEGFYNYFMEDKQCENIFSCPCFVIDSRMSIVEKISEVKKIFSRRI